MENTQRDPSSPWKTPAGSWRLRTYNQHVYEAENDAAVLRGQWKDLGVCHSSIATRLWGARGL